MRKSAREKTPSNSLDFPLNSLDFKVVIPSEARDLGFCGRRRSAGQNPGPSLCSGWQATACNCKERAVPS